MSFILIHGVAFSIESIFVDNHGVEGLNWTSACRINNESLAKHF